VRQFAAFASNARADEIPLSRRPSCRIADVRFLVFTNTAVSPGNSVSIGHAIKICLAPKAPPPTTTGVWMTSTIRNARATAQRAAAIYQSKLATRRGRCEYRNKRTENYGSANFLFGKFVDEQKRDSPAIGVVLYSTFAPVTPLRSESGDH
jgi:hypothetical protein